ncbi:hypothetical protein Tco_0911071 [Tanacetum coccineum]|uniref:Retrovirus-related Pol polyprotein from transposon TNT 1-94 n=1 Tax=Tanacetum coccineum TaxID=301880 RepID=A0ABQ5CXW8_9ASTR
MLTLRVQRGPEIVGYIEQDFQENSDVEVDERTSEEYLRDLNIEFHERALLVKVKLALLEVSPSTTQSPKPFQSKNKGMVAETFDCDKEEVFDDEEMTQVNVLMALADDELVVVKNHARNGEWIDITMRKVVNERRGLTKAPANPESSKESRSKPLTPLPPLKVL